MKKTLIVMFSILIGCSLVFCKDDPKQKALKHIEKTNKEIELLVVAASTWSKLQMAYNMETDKVGSNIEIGFTPPGASSPSNSSEYGYFKYKTNVISDKIVVWEAKLIESIGDCYDVFWTITADIDSDGKLKFKGKISGAGECLKLAPDFCKSENFKCDELVID